MMEQRTFTRPLIAVVFCLIVFGCQAQQPGETIPAAGTDSAVLPKWSVSGYLKDLQYVQFVHPDEPWTLNNLIHNRLDVHWYPSGKWKLHLGVRNRFYYGQSVGIYSMNDSLLNNPDGYFNLGKVIASGKSFILHSMIDRASVDYTSGKWEITAGRQRINWGVNLVWNPNDIFNAYSYFDFDYEERPGTDALRVQYYINSTSSVELAAKPGRNSKGGTVAGLYRFTHKTYDLQFLAGKANEDYVVGVGWSGLLGTAGFNGEVTAFVPGSGSLSHTVVAASAGANYTFPGSFYLHGAYLYNSGGGEEGLPVAGSLLREYATAKNLSPAMHSLFAEAAYQLTPLIRGDVAGIFSPSDGSLFVGPALTFSLTNNIDFLSGAQLFLGKSGTFYGGYGTFIYLRLKWSF